jgi:biopolymer transport protein ExbD
MKTTPRKRPRPPQLLNGIDLWAFLSVQIVLLVIFMVAPNRPHRHAWALDFTRTDHATSMPGALREDAMLITITRDGNIFFGYRQIRPRELAQSLHDSVRRGSERKVYLKVDARARYSDAALVIDQVREAGIQDIGIITEQRMLSPR